MLRAMRAFVFGCMTAMSSSLVAQATFLVPSHYPDIPSAITASANGDTIVVAPGVHAGPVNFAGKNLRIVASGGSGVTTIDAAGGGSAVLFVGGESALARLEGFTITGGTAVRGGGICMIGSSPVIEDCRIVGNQATSHGGGLYCENGSPLIDRCLFANDEVEVVSYANENVSARGGGAAFVGSGQPNLRRCAFTTNLASATTYGTDPADAFGQGGAISVEGSVAVTIDRSVFFGNTADSQEFNQHENVSARSRGGAIFVEGSTAALALTHSILASNQTTVSGNRTSGHGAAVAAVGGASVAIAYSTLADNVATTDGGAVGLNVGAQVTVESSIVWSNAPTAFAIEGSGATLSVTSSDVDGGHPGPGNIDANPLFVDSQAHDYHLSLNSPCMDVGSPAALGYLGRDIDGNLRVLDGSPDIGADESLHVPGIHAGSGDDFVLETQVNGAGDPAAIVKTVTSGDSVTVTMRSPFGSYVGERPVLFAQVFSNGAIPASPTGFPEVHCNVHGGIVLFDALSTDPVTLLAPAGWSDTFNVGSIQPGLSFVVQAICFNLVAENGIFAATNAHHIHVQ